MSETGGTGRWVPHDTARGPPVILRRAGGRRQHRGAAHLVGHHSLPTGQPAKTEQSRPYTPQREHNGTRKQPSDVQTHKAVTCRPAERNDGTANLSPSVLSASRGTLEAVPTSF